MTFDLQVKGHIGNSPRKILYEILINTYSIMIRCIHVYKQHFWHLSRFFSFILFLPLLFPFFLPLFLQVITHPKHFAILTSTLAVVVFFCLLYCFFLSVYIDKNKLYDNQSNWYYDSFLASATATSKRAQIYSTCTS